MSLGSCTWSTGLIWMGFNPKKLSLTKEFVSDEVAVKITIILFHQACYDGEAKEATRGVDGVGFH